MITNRLAASAVATVLACSLAVLTACSGSAGKLADSTYVGTWKAVTAEYDGTTIDVDTVMDEYTIELKADGTAAVTVDGETGTGPWDETDSGIKLEGNGVADFELDAVGDQLTVNYGGAEIFFQKQ